MKQHWRIKIKEREKRGESERQYQTTFKEEKERRKRERECVFMKCYLSKAGSTRRVHLALLAEVLVVSVEDRARETGASHHLVVFSQPAEPGNEE